MIILKWEFRSYCSGFPFCIIDKKEAFFYYSSRGEIYEESTLLFLFDRERKTSAHSITCKFEEQTYRTK